MASTNGSGRPAGCISIPVEIIREPNSNNSTSQSRHQSPYTSFHNDNYGGFSDSPPWNSSMNTNTGGRFLPRSSPNSAYDRLINNSQFNQPLFDRPSYQAYQDPQYRHPQQRMYEPGPSHFSRSNEDLLSSPFDSVRYSTQQPYSSTIPPPFGSGNYRPDSDFLQSNKYTSPLRRSFDALNDFPDMYQNFPPTRQPPSTPQQQQQQQQQPYYRSSFQTQHQPQQQQQPGYSNQTFINPNIVYTDEYGAPTDQYQPNTFQEANQFSHDRARSPASQRGPSPAPQPPRGPSPARTSPPTQPQQTQQQQQQQQPAQAEPELKMAKDADGPIPMPAPPSATAPPADHQTPTADASATAAPPPAPATAPEGVRDPNTIALEKLEEIKRSLEDLEAKVDAFNGSTRNDKNYKVLDEQALKIMIRCDELVDVSADIKEKRKEMIRNVQRVITKLETKVPVTPAAEQNSNPMEVATTTTETTESTAEFNEQASSPKASTPSTSPPKETISTPAVDQSVSA